MKILILKFNALGDVVRTSYILPGLCEKYDNPVIDWVSSNEACELLRYNPYIRILASPQSGFEFFNHNHYDLVLSLDDEDNVLKLIENIEYEALIGAYLQNEKKCYSENSSEWFDMGLISRFGKNIADEMKKKNEREHNQILEDMLGIKIVSGIFFNSPLIEKRVEVQFDKKFFNIGLNPSAGTRWKSKEMPFNEICCLIERLMRYRIDNKSIRVHLLGGMLEENRHLEIQKKLNGCNVKNWGGQNTLLEFAAIVKGCDYVVTGDTLGLHFSIAQKIPNLSYYAPTSANEIGTFGTGSKVVSLSDDYCSYRSDADNSTITATRLINALKLHWLALSLPVNTSGSGASG